MQRCIDAGVSKINVNKLVLDEYLQDLPVSAGKKNLTTLMEDGVEMVSQAMEHWMDACGSSGKA